MQFGHMIRAFAYEGMLMTEKPKREPQPKRSNRFGCTVLVLLAILIVVYLVAYPTTPNARNAAATQTADAPPMIAVPRWQGESDACHANRAELVRLQASGRYLRASIPEQAAMERPYLTTATRLDCPLVGGEGGDGS
jgi:hypothetical protein